STVKAPLDAPSSPRTLSAVGIELWRNPVVVLTTRARLGVMDELGCPVAHPAKASVASATTARGPNWMVGVMDFMIVRVRLQERGNHSRIFVQVRGGEPPLAMVAGSRSTRSSSYSHSHSVSSVLSCSLSHP